MEQYRKCNITMILQTDYSTGTAVAGQAQEQQSSSLAEFNTPGVYPGILPPRGRIQGGGGAPPVDPSSTPGA